jgi:arylformamidase
MRDYELVDLSHAVEAGMITYQGLPAPVISDHLSREQSRDLYAPGTEFHIGKIEMVANTGTYIDSPFHRYADGSDLSELDLRSLANLDAVVVRKQSDRAISVDDVAGVPVKGRAILFNTGWDTHWRTETYWNGAHPFVTSEAATHLAEHGAVLVGIDSYNIDDTADGSRPAHSILLKAGIPIICATWEPCPMMVFNSLPSR